ncbi:hypothetical protein Tco_0473085 [Tanacetum coccineum]
MSHEEVVEEESDSDSDAEIRLIGSLVETSKQKLLKRFTYINKKGETFQMTQEQIENQKGIEKAVKADVAKSNIKKGKKDLIDLVGLNVVEKMYMDKVGTVLNELSLGMILFNSKQRQDFISIEDFEELNNEMLYNVQENFFRRHKRPRMYDLARTFSSLLVATVEKRNLNPNVDPT